MFKLSIALTLTACAFLLLPLEKSSNAKPSKQAPQQTAINLTRLYNDTCAKCHGEQGEGGGGGTKTLLTLEKFGAEHDKPFFDAIKKGVPDMGMDAYGPTMSDETIWGLVVHLRELQNKYTEALVAGPKETEGVYASQRAKFRLETVVEKGKGLAVPWGIDWLPDGKMLITNRPGALRLSQNGEVGPEITGLPATREIGQGGLMDVAVHPNYAKNGWVYLSAHRSIAHRPKGGNDQDRARQAQDRGPDGIVA